LVARRHLRHRVVQSDGLVRRRRATAIRTSHSLETNIVQVRKGRHLVPKCRVMIPYVVSSPNRVKESRDLLRTSEPGKCGGCGHTSEVCECSENVL
jgi:hypothetical protein